LEGYEFRSINIDELAKLNNLITKQAKGRLDYFKPHNFDLKSLSIAYSNPSLIMMGVFLEKEMVGYFFLRCFWNKKCFVGRLIDQNHEGKGIGRVMNDIMYNIAWGEGFRCLSTISKSNQQVMRSHANNKRMVILKELPNDYLLVEFIKS